MTDTPEVPLLHGTLPLAPDPSAALGVRFADPASTASDPLVRAPAELPDAELTLRVFRGARERDGYRAALEETGGNAFSWLESPPSPNTPPMLLVARWDRPRRPGDALDEAVALSGAGPDDVAAFAKARASARTGAERLAAQARFEAAWRAEQDVLASTPDVFRAGESGISRSFG